MLQNINNSKLFLMFRQRCVCMNVMCAAVLVTVFSFNPRIIPTIITNEMRITWTHPEKIQKV